MASSKNPSGGVVAVLGSAGMDLVVQQERLAGLGETIFGSVFSTVPGGKGQNQAIAAARAGARVEFLGAVGDDAYGREILELMATEGIGTEALSVAPTTTGTAHISVLDSGENSIVVVSGANATVTTLTERQREMITASDFLVMQFELPIEVIAEAATLAAESDTVTVLTPAPVIEFDTALLKNIDILVPNEHEVVQLADVSDPERAAEQLSATVGGSVVVTLGAEGSLHAHRGEITERIPARKVQAVDTTSAGDTFVGVLVARLAAGDPFSRAARWASVAASIGVTRLGASSSVPTWAEIEAVGIEGL